MAVFCTKCGAKIPRGAKFCEKCGNPVEDIQKRQTGKKTLAIGISAGAVLMIGVVVLLVVSGTIGGKKETMQTSSGKGSIQEPQVQATEPPTAAATESPEPQTVADSETLLVEAYEAYKKYIEEDEGVAKDYYDIWNNVDTGTTFDDFKLGYGEGEQSPSYSYSLFYLDADDYPEMIVSCFKDDMASAAILLYTYKAGTVTLKDDSFGGDAYKEKEGYIHAGAERIGNGEADRIGFYDGNTIQEVFSYCDETDLGGNRYINGRKVSKKEYEEQMAENYGTDEDWKETQWENSIDGAFIELQRSDSPAESPDLQADTDNEPSISEVYEAYQKCIADGEIAQEYSRRNKDHWISQGIGPKSGTYASFVKENAQFSYDFIYLDADNYPEMLVSCCLIGPNDVSILLYSYQNGEVGLKNNSFFSSQDDSIFYKERQGLLHTSFERGYRWDKVGAYDGDTITKVYDSADNEEELSEKKYKKQLAKYIGNENDWTSIEWYDSMEEAFDKLK